MDKFHWFKVLYVTGLLLSASCGTKGQIDPASTGSARRLSVAPEAPDTGPEFAAAVRLAYKRMAAEERRQFISATGYVMD